MAAIRLTKKLVDALAPKATDHFVWDETVKGFGVKITPKGAKSFVAQYRPAGERASKRVKLGSYGVLTVEQARKMAQEVLGGVAGGRNPSEENRRRREAPTVTEIAPRFLQRQQAVSAPRTVAEVSRVFARHVLPRLGGRKVADILHSDISKLHTALRATPVQANRVLAYCSSFFGWCEREGYREGETNPCRGVARYREKGRERYLTHEELAALGIVLEEAANSGLRPTVEAITAAATRNVVLPDRLPPDPDGVDVIRLLLFTGARKGEILGLQWDQIDLARGLMTLAETKTGRSVRFLSAPALELLYRRRSERPDGAFVFPGPQPAMHLKGIDRLWDRVRDAANIRGVRLHDLRHTFASFGASGGMSLPIIGRLLGHSRSVTTERYAHLANDPLALAAKQIGAEIDAALAGRRTGVTSIRRAKQH